MNNPHGVRRATEADIPALISLVPQILAETEVLELSNAKIGELIWRCCHQQYGALAGVIDGEDGAVDASIGMTFRQSEVSDEPYISVAWFGLAPHARKLPAAIKADTNHPRGHYGRRLADFAKWAHGTMEEAAGRRIIMRWDVLTLEQLGPKLDMYGRNFCQIGAYFALGAAGAFKPRGQVAEAP